MDNETHYCRDCKQTLPVAQFYRLTINNRQYYQSYCRPCSCVRTKRWNVAHREQATQARAKYRQSHRADTRAKYRQRSAEQIALDQARNRAAYQRRRGDILPTRRQKYQQHKEYVARLEQLVSTWCPHEPL